MARGNLNTIQQTQTAQLSGGVFAKKIITTDVSVRTDGHLLMTDSHGNAVDSGISATGISAGTSATPILDSSADPIYDSIGDWIFPG